MSQLSRSVWRATRTEARGRSGAVAAKHELGAEAGVQVLRDGGNAVDAAVAMAFTVAVVEPYMSGLGGGGFMVVYDAARGDTAVIDFAMVAPIAARPDMFPLIPKGGPTGFFGWDAVENDANIVGHKAAAVPGAVAGLLLAHQRYGRLPIGRLMEPAIGYARGGVDVDWYTCFQIGAHLGTLRRFPDTASIFAPGRLPLAPTQDVPTSRLIQPDLARTLQTIAGHGSAAFYGGEIAEAIHEEMARHGGLITREDLAAYRPRVHTPGLAGRYRGHTLIGPPAPSGAPTVFETLALSDRFDLAAFGHGSPETLHVFAEAGLQAFADRMAHLADPSQSERAGIGGADRDIVAHLLSDGYIERTAARIDPRGYRTSSPGAVDGPDRRERTTTTLAAADGAGNAVALTTTLLSSFGCGVTVPGTGVLLNNGMMWFDPRPDRPNSAGPGKRPLNNMSPILVLREGRPMMVVGAMGGRRIIDAVAAIVSNVVDFGMTMQEACEAPRLDLSTGEVLADSRLPADVIENLRRRGHVVRVQDDTFGAFEYGSPAAILIEPDGLMRTGVDPLNPAAAAAF